MKQIILDKIIEMHNERVRLKKHPLHVQKLDLSNELIKLGNYNHVQFLSCLRLLYNEGLIKGGFSMKGGYVLPIKK